MDAYIFPLDRLPTGAELEALIDALPFGKEERLRLYHIQNPHARRQSLGALLALQRLTEARGLPPCPISRSALGKPSFVNPALPHFSLTHAANLAVAFLGDTQNDSVGVDLEFVRPRKHLAALASRFFTTEEYAMWESLGMDTESFYQVWTRKEAASKYAGKSLLDDLTIPLLYFNTLRLTHGNESGFLTFASGHCEKPTLTCADPSLSTAWVL